MIIKFLMILSDYFKFLLHPNLNKNLIYQSFPLCLLAINFRSRALSLLLNAKILTKTLIIYKVKLMR